MIITWKMRPLTLALAVVLACLNCSQAFTTPQVATRTIIEPDMRKSCRTQDFTKCFVSRRFFHGEDSVVTELVDKQSASGTSLLLAPVLTAWLAFATYTDVSQGFHNFVDVASGHTWAPVDGGAYLTDLITPALTGPVAGFITLLFGTLTSMTVGNLFNRQAQIARLLGDCLENLRLLEVHTKTFPTKAYRDAGEKLILAYGSIVVDILDQGRLPTEELKTRRETGRRLLEKNMSLLHRISGDPAVQDRLNGRAMDEAYATLNRLIQGRANLITAYENCFPIWHYGNLCILALADMFIFLVLTDKTALLFLGGFQLRMCWALMIGSLSMLAVVLYDLNSPLSGAFQVVKPVKLSEFDLESRIEAASSCQESEEHIVENWIDDFMGTR